MPICVGPPEFYLQQNESMEVNTNEEVILNCSASSSPPSVYTWIIPSVCSSCQKHSNNSTVTFIANISNSGKYICEAENDYGSITKQITINVFCKFIYMHTYCMQYLDQRKLEANIRISYSLSSRAL